RVRVSGFAPIETLTRRALRVGLSQRERRFPHPAPGQADRFKNWLISRTTAEVPIHVMDDLGVRGFRTLIEQRFGSEDHSWRAEPALKCELIKESLLNRVKLIAAAEPFDSRDPPPARFISEVRARAHGQAIDQRRTCAAYL